VEITTPLAVSLDRLNSLLDELGEPPLGEQDHLPVQWRERHQIGFI
jgi:hypothetical protein